MHAQERAGFKANDDPSVRLENRRGQAVDHHQQAEKRTDHVKILLGLGEISMSGKGLEYTVFMEDFCAGKVMFVFTDGDKRDNMVVDNFIHMVIQEEMILYETATSLRIL